jgi:deoxyribonuclease V
VLVAFGGPGPGGERAWAAAVLWRPESVVRRRDGEPFRRSEDALRGRTDKSRQASDVDAQVVVEGTVLAPYVPGLLALRQGLLLVEAVERLPDVPDVLLVDATGLDHPRRAGLAMHLGAFRDIPTVGVTHRPLLGTGTLPARGRGERSPVAIDGEIVGYWVRTPPGIRPVAAHAGWRTSPETAVDVVLMTSTAAARTPVPLQEARRLAREARSGSAAP